MFCAWSLGLSGSALSSSEYNLCKGGLYSDVSEFPDFTLTTALRTWPSRPWSKCSIFPTICSCTQTMSPTCTSRGEFALLKYRSCSRSSVRYSDLHRFQKWFRTRCRNLALVSAVPLRPTLVVLSVGIDRILRLIIRWEGVSSLSISSHIYVNGREFKSPSTSTETVESSTKFSRDFRKHFLKLSLTEFTIRSKKTPHQGCLDITLDTFTMTIGLHSWILI